MFGTGKARASGAEAAAQEYSAVIFEALRAAATSKAVPPRGLMQMLGTLQAKLAGGGAMTAAPDSTRKLLRGLAEMMAALNAGLAEYESSFLGQMDRQLLAMSQPPEPPADPPARD